MKYAACCSSFDKESDLVIYKEEDSSKATNHVNQFTSRADKPLVSFGVILSRRYTKHKQD